MTKERACPAALQPDVRKACGLPTSVSLIFPGLRPWLAEANQGRSPKIDLS
jgi:hypothetical protein